MTVYLDSSAMFKLVVEESETTALRSWLASRREGLATNVIGAVEVRRAVRRMRSGDVTVEAVIAGFTQLALTPAILARAGALPPALLRTLDALHIASAQELADLTALVTYDRRMAEAASSLGLPVASPGA